MRKRRILVRYLKEDFEPCDIFMFMGDEVDISYQQTQFMTGKDIRDMRDSRVHDVYMNGYDVPWKQKIVKPVMKWKAPTKVCKEEKQSKLDTAVHVQSQTIKGVFMFGSAARKATERKSSLPTLQEWPSH